MSVGIITAEGVARAIADTEGEANAAQRQLLCEYVARCARLRQACWQMVRQQRQVPGVYNADQIITMLEALVQEGTDP